MEMNRSAVVISSPVREPTAAGSSAAARRDGAAAMTAAASMRDRRGDARLSAAAAAAAGMRAWAPTSAMNPAEDRAEQRKEDDRRIHRSAQPFIRLMSSTAMVPRLRK